MRFGEDGAPPTRSTKARSEEKLRAQSLEEICGEYFSSDMHDAYA